MKAYQFFRSGTDWYIDLPEFLEQGGSIGDLQMVEGADKMLDMMAGDEQAVTLTISKEAFDGADTLVLTEKCDPQIGGGYYMMHTYQGTIVNRNMWLCHVTEFVFGELPPTIFLRKEISVDHNEDIYNR